ncbi:MAG: hypothetical protein R2749_11595 [Acidimicrobiales bacterium]
MLFLAGVAGLLLLDLFVLHRDAHVIKPQEAAVTSAAWVALGLSFTFVVWAWLGGTAASQYITGYLIEKSLSVDNVFVWAVIFGYFSVPGSTSTACCSGASSARWRCAPSSCSQASLC